MADKTGHVATQLVVGREVPSLQSCEEDSAAGTQDPREGDELGTSEAFQELEDKGGSAKVILGDEPADYSPPLCPEGGALSDLSEAGNDGCEVIIKDDFSGEEKTGWSSSSHLLPEGRPWNDVPDAKEETYSAQIGLVTEDKGGSDEEGKVSESPPMESNGDKTGEIFEDARGRSLGQVNARGSRRATPSPGPKRRQVQHAPTVSTIHRGSPTKDVRPAESGDVGFEDHSQGVPQIDPKEQNEDEEEEETY